MSRVRWGNLTTVLPSYLLTVQYGRKVVGSANDIHCLNLFLQCGLLVYHWWSIRTSLNGFFFSYFLCVHESTAKTNKSWFDKFKSEIVRLYDGIPGWVKNGVTVSLYLSVWKTRGDKWMDVKAMSVSMNPQLTFCLTMNYLWSFATKERAFPLKPFSRFSVGLMC